MWSCYKIYCFCLLMASVNGQFPQNVTQNIGNYQNAYPCTDKNHIFLIPGVLASGSNNRGCLSRFHTDGSALLALTITTADKQSTNVYKDLPPGDGGCVDFSIPQLPNTKAEVTVRVSYPSYQCTWEQQLTVRVASSRAVYIQVERSRFRPGETVRARLLALRGDFTPRHSPIEEIWLEGPSGEWGEGTRVTEWQRVRTRLGLAQIQYRLEDRATPGKWTVRARLADGSQGSATFWVGDYQLPPFQLSVKHSPRVLRTSERLVWTVCVRYPWSEAVEGMLVIRLRGAGGREGGVRTAVRLRAPRACHRHAVAAKRVGLEDEERPDVVIADFSFQEDGTGIWQNTTVVSQVVEKPITLDFVSKQLTFIAPGLPYKLKVKATRWDGKPSPNENIQVCKYPDSQPYETAEDQKTNPHALKHCNNATTDAKGVAKVAFIVPDDGVKFFKFEASITNRSDIESSPMYLPTLSGGVGAVIGPIINDDRVAGSNSIVPLYVNVDTVKPMTVHFVLITRGGVIFRWGATTQCPSLNPGTKIQTTHRHAECPQRTEKSPPDQQSDPDALTKHLAKVLLPIRISHQMCPESNLVAYFYHEGVMVSASKHLEFEDCFEAKVEATWNPRQVAPSSTASLHIKAPPSSLCALSAVDVASKWLQDHAPTVKEVLLHSVQRIIYGNKNMTAFDAFGDCSYLENFAEPVKGIDLTELWLSEAGVRSAGGDVRARRRCDVTPPAAITSDTAATAPRTDFSEAWLWRLAAVGPNGTVVVPSKVPDSITRFEASALCVSKSGVSFSQPAVIQVFREFFIHGDAPKTLRRGDTTLMQYRIFNYLYEPLAVQIQILVDPHLEILSPIVESACIAPRASIARRAKLRARIPGKARLSVRAYAKYDSRCGNGTSSGNYSRVSDEVIMQINVDHEGVPTKEYKSALLCAEGNPYSPRHEVTWKWSKVETVPETEAVVVWADTDIRGTLYADADNLIQLPKGCGEQNMARLATNLLALGRVDPASPAAATAKDHVARGFARQVQYAHPTGGFSAFGSPDGIPSTWLTAFSVRYLRRAHQLLSPGSPVPSVIERAERWLINQQMENGCFRNEGQVFHRELKGGLGEEGEVSNVAMTAYVITSLVEGSVNIPSRVLRNSLSCLRALRPFKTKTQNRVYAQALLAYTFTRLKKYEEDLRKTNEAFLRDRRSQIGAGLQDDEDMREVQELLRMARWSEDFVWWETGSLSTSIEATGYALLAISRSPHSASEARAAVRWLSAHRSGHGGFLSTQDTLIALEALSLWSSLLPTSPARLRVTCQSGGSEVTMGNLPARLSVIRGEQLIVSVEGEGCALVQATRSYNTPSPQREKNKVLSVQVQVHTEGPFHCDKNGTFCYCATVIETCVLWTGSFPEMALLDATLPGGFGADASKLYAQLQEPRTLVRRIEVSPNANRVTFYLGSRDGNDVTTSGSGHQCYSVHAVGPRGRTKPAHVLLHDYYRPDVNDTQVYTIPEDCPARISHNDTRYIRSENLFANARSLDDKIIISDDFTFDDIPEGFPLEDPFYDNLFETGVPKLNTKAKTVDLELPDDKLKTSETLKESNDVSLADENRNYNEIETKTHAQIKEAENLRSNDTEDNPNFTDFHVINNATDLDVPTGVEGPVPSVVLPPPGFVANNQPRGYEPRPALMKENYLNKVHRYPYHYYIDYYDYGYPPYIHRFRRRPPG